jgi:hypothetical protein
VLKSLQGRSNASECVLKPYLKNLYAYNFYETKPDHYKWFAFPDRKELVAKAIAEKLKKVTFN